MVDGHEPIAALSEEASHASGGHTSVKRKVDTLASFDSAAATTVALVKQKVETLAASDSTAVNTVALVKRKGEEKSESPHKKPGPVVIDLSNLSEEQLGIIIKKYDLVQKSITQKKQPIFYDFIDIQQHYRRRPGNFKLDTFKTEFQNLGVGILQRKQPLNNEIERLCQTLLNYPPFNKPSSSSSSSSPSTTLIKMLSTIFNPDDAKRKDHPRIQNELFADYEPSLCCQISKLFDDFPRRATLVKIRPLTSDDCDSPGWQNCDATQTDLIYGKSHLTIYVFLGPATQTFWPGSHYLSRLVYSNTLISSLRHEQRTDKIQSTTIELGMLDVVVIQSDLLHHISPWTRTTGVVNESGFVQWSLTNSSTFGKMETRKLVQSIVSSHSIMSAVKQKQHMNIYSSYVTRTVIQNVKPATRQNAIIITRPRQTLAASVNALRLIQSDIEGGTGSPGTAAFPPLPETSPNTVLNLKSLIMLQPTKEVATMTGTKAVASTQ